MPDHFGAPVAISRFQRLKINTRSHPERCPGLLHFAPLALGIQVLTQTLNSLGQRAKRYVVREADGGSDLPWIAALFQSSANADGALSTFFATPAPLRHRSKAVSRLPPHSKATGS